MTSEPTPSPGDDATTEGTESTESSDPLQQALAAEHAAVWVYGFLGARVSSSERERLHALLVRQFEAHRAARDDLAATLAERGEDPVASQVDYREPDPADSPRQISGAAREVEERVARVYVAVVGTTAGGDRALAVAGLRRAAVASLDFGGTPTDLPGLD